MQEYNNTVSYPDPVRAARVKVDNVHNGVWDFLYGRNVDSTGEFCVWGAWMLVRRRYGGGPLMYHEKGRYIW